MKKTQKGSTTVVLLTIIIVLILGFGLYFYKNQKSEITTVPEQTNNQVVQDNNSKSYESADFSITYAKDTFTQVQMSQHLPPKYLTPYAGIKLISPSRATLIGKNQCSYGESDIISTCTAEKEGGISFVVVNDSISNLTSELDASLKTNTTISGKQAVVWKIGAEGAGADYYFVAINQNKTLMITRLYTDEGFPSNDSFDEIKSTLKIK